MCEILKMKKNEKERLWREFREEIDKRLQTIIYAVAGFLASEHRVELTITQLIRTEAEQDIIYLNHPDPAVRAEYQRRPWLSVHQVGRGADIRVRWSKRFFNTTALSREEQDKIASSIDAFLDSRFDYDFGRLETSVRHDIGRGDHIHIQVDGNQVTRMLR